MESFIEPAPMRKRTMRSSMARRPSLRRVDRPRFVGPRLARLTNADQICKGDCMNTTDRTKDKIDLAALKARTAAHNVVDKTSDAAKTVGEKVEAAATTVGEK